MFRILLNNDCAWCHPSLPHYRYRLDLVSIEATTILTHGVYRQTQVDLKIQNLQENKDNFPKNNYNALQ